MVDQSLVRALLNYYYCKDINVERVVLEWSVKVQKIRVTLYYFNGRVTRFMRDPTYPCYQGRGV